MSTSPSLRSFLSVRARWIVAIAALAILVSILGQNDFGADGTLERSLLVALRQEVLVSGPVVRAEQDSGPFTYTDLYFLGRVSATSPADLYFVEARISGDAVISSRNLRNLTRTSSADERALVHVSDAAIAYASFVDGSYDAVTLIGTEGEPEALTADWPRRARLQNHITNFQETGLTGGIGRRRYALAERSETIALDSSTQTLQVTTDAGVIHIDLDSGAATAGEELVVYRPHAKGMPGTLTWVVDSIRNLSFVGPEPIAWLEHRVFAVKDALQRFYYGVAGGPDTETEVAEELGLQDFTPEQTRRRAELSVTDPELGWPPGSLTPVVRRPARGEGEWLPVVDDPFVRSYPGAPPAFYTTFLQVDPDRPFTRVYVVVWDPRALQLRVMTGTREPESATGATGSGMVPREPEVLSRVVAGFNGGFQSLHGEFGMMAEGEIYLPPKPWAATVGVYEDGRVAMGSWTDPPEGVRHYREQWAVRQIPEGMREFRQNLTSVIEDDRINPWRRWYWGAAPQGDDEQAYIDRSGMCLTTEGFMAYFWGKSMGADELGEAMKAARCVRGIHLDMNQRHTAFEFYNVFDEEHAPQPVGRRLTSDFEFEINVPRARGWRARGRLLARSMTPMRFPRYIRQDPRDFFYLTIRPVLPGPALETETEVPFETGGLPHGGWPPAFAMAKVGETDAETFVVRLDASRAVPSPVFRRFPAHSPELETPAETPDSAAGETEPDETEPDAATGETEPDDTPDGSNDAMVEPAQSGPRALAYLSNAGAMLTGEVSLVMTQNTVGRTYRIGTPGRDDRVILAGPALPDVAEGAALGVDSDGFLVYVEGVDLRQWMTAARVEAAIHLPADVRLAYALEELNVGPDTFERELVIADALVFFANETPASEVLFPDVEPRPYMYWGRMQDTRVRYFRGDSAPRFVAPDPEP